MSKPGGIRFAVGSVSTASLVVVAWLLWPPQQTVSDFEDDGPAVSGELKVAVELAQSGDVTSDIAASLLKLALRSPEKAWLRATALEQPGRESILRLVAKMWIARDPNAAMNAFETMEEGLVSAGWMFEMLARWMVMDEEGAANWALSRAAGRSRSLIVGAINWLLTHADNRDPAFALAERVFQRWAQEEPVAAWEAAAKRLAGRSDSLRVVAEVWFEADPQAALDAAVSPNLWEHRWVPDLVGEWAEVAPREATEWALALTPGPYDPSIDEVTRFGFRARLLAPALAALSVEAPVEAFDLIQGFSEGERNQINYYTKYWLRGLVGDDPRDLAAWLAGQPDENLRVNTAGLIARLYREADPHEALQWALDLPAKESGKALGMLVGPIARDNPQFAEDIVLSVVEPDAQIPAAATLLDHRSRVLGHAAAYHWAVENLSSAVRREASEGLFFRWGMSDPTGAAAAVEVIADLDERMTAMNRTVLGMVMAIDGDEISERRHERMLVIDRLYPRLTGAVFPNAWTDSNGRDLVSYKLHQYWKDIDPQRASKYRAKAAPNDRRAQRGEMGSLRTEGSE